MINFSEETDDGVVLVFSGTTCVGRIDLRSFVFEPTEDLDYLYEQELRLIAFNINKLKQEHGITQQP